MLDRPGVVSCKKFALLLQGGGALGACQAGVYEALAEADLCPDWVTGTSIGGINSAIIAGNTRERRVAKLREFWELVSRSPFGFDGDLGPLLARGEPRARRSTRRLGGHKVRPMPTDIARYSIELFKPGGEGAGIEEILDRHADLKIARSIYRTRFEQYPGRLIMLCDHARVLARSDRTETMPR